MSTQEILIETKRVGHSVRVTAIDAHSGTEVTFQAPMTASPLQIRRLAADKMRYVMGNK